MELQEEHRQMHGGYGEHGEYGEQGKTEAMSAEVLATVGHELRSPLTSIKGYTATLLRQERRLSREERHEFLLAIHDASERLQAIVDRFLEMSALETGNIGLRRTLVDAAPIAREALLNTERYASEHMPGKFSFHLRLKDERGQAVQELPLVPADPRLLREVLDNLLDNAILYSPDGGRIDIVIRPLSSSMQKDGAGQSKAGEHAQAGTNERETASEAPTMLDICVCDHGLGIPPDHLERIFERFHRVDTGLTRTANGLGLGLTVSKRIIAMHGGDIWAESCSVGGSAFHVLLPLPDGSEQDGDDIL